MKKVLNILARIMVMAICFAITVVFVNKFQNRYYGGQSVEMADSTLPLVYVNYGDTYINCLHGYTTSVDTTLLRDAITPISDDKSITLSIDDADSYAAAYAYELRSVSGGSLIESGDLATAQGEDGYLQATINIRMDIQDDTEYMLIFLITNESGDTARYYTRIVVNNNYHASNLLSFVEKFNKATFDIKKDEEDSYIYKYKEAYTATDEDDDLTMGHITLASSYESIIWSGVTHEIITSAIPTIKEIDTNYAVIELDYVTQTTDEEGDVDYYAISEYYRVSYADGIVTLMNFDRYIDEYFNRTEVDTQKNAYEIGVVSDEDVTYVTSSDNKKVSFVRNGQLWLYNYAKNEITFIFGFWLDDVEDARDTYGNHDINIISMDDDGNMTFAVYGYMNRGDHEGRLGISLYDYDASSREITELVFVECNQPYAAMEEELSRLTYYDGMYLYFMLGGKIYSVNVADKQASTFVEGISMDSVYVSDDMTILIYQASDDQTSNTSLTFVNLSTGTTKTIKASISSCIRCYGFKDNDFIYGLCYKSDAEYSLNEKSFAKKELEDEDYELIPAYKLMIIDESGDTIKQYQKGENYIVNVTIDENMIYMTRGTKSGSTFVLAEDDFITYKVDDSVETVTTASKTSTEGMKKLYFVMPASIYLTYTPYIYITKNTAESGGSLLVELDPVSGYMVYSNLGLVDIYDTAGEAIVAAVDVSGIVVSSDGTIVYRQSDALEYNTIASAITHYSSGTVEDSLNDCIYMTLTYQGASVTYSQVAAYDDPVTALTDLGKYAGAEVTGISMELLVAYIGEGVPVICRIDDGRYVLAVSYNSEAIRYYDPVLGDEVKVTRSSFQTAMNKCGGELYTYIKE